jgi:AraC-like DNA-binding protein
MNHNGFIRLFSTETGFSNLQYSRRKRVEKACLLLHFTNQLDEIARKTGFQYRYYFSRVFKQVTNYSPAQYKRTEKAIK